MANKLPIEFLDLNDLTSNSRGVSVLYGRRLDGSLVAIQVADDGLLASSATFSGGSLALEDGTVPATKGKIKFDGTDNALVVVQNAPVTGSTNAYFEDQAGTGLNLVFAQQLFSFDSFSMTLINDDASDTIEFSFDGVNIHGRLGPFESMVMDNRKQPSIYLRSDAAAGTAYRLMVY